MSAISERARAKINLTLRVLGRRADGYHLLESLIVFAGVGDDVTFEPGVPRGRRDVGSLRRPPSPAAISSIRRSQALAAADPILTLGRVSVDKQLPIAAGIGGGSADAAAVLRAVRRINPANGVDWERLAAALGADVSVCLADRSSLRLGRRRARRAGRRPAAPRCGARLPAKRRAVRQDQDPCSAGLPSARRRRRRRRRRCPAFRDAAALIDYMRGVGNDLRDARPCRAARQRRSGGGAERRRRIACTSASPAPVRRATGFSPMRARAAAAAERLRARHPRLVDRRHHPRRLTPG